MSPPVRQRCAAPFIALSACVLATLFSLAVSANSQPRSGHRQLDFSETFSFPGYGHLTQLAASRSSGHLVAVGYQLNPDDLPRHFTGWVRGIDSAARTTEFHTQLDFGEETWPASVVLDENDIAWIGGRIETVSGGIGFIAAVGREGRVQLFQALPQVWNISSLVLEESPGGSLYAVAGLPPLGYPDSYQIVELNREGRIVRQVPIETPGPLEWGILGLALDDESVYAVTSFAEDEGRSPAADIGPGGSTDVAILSYSRLDLQRTDTVVIGGRGPDFGMGLIALGKGQVVLYGNTYLQGFPGTEPPHPNHARAGDPDAFVVRLDLPQRSLLWGRRIGSVGWEEALDAAVRDDTSIVIAGTAGGYRFPRRRPLQPGTLYIDAFAVELDLNDGKILFSTTFGGISQDYANAVTVTNAGLPAFGGFAWGDFPLRRTNSPSGGPGAAFVSIISEEPPSGRLQVVKRSWGNSREQQIILRNVGEGPLRGTVSGPSFRNEVVSGGGDFVLRRGAQHTVLIRKPEGRSSLAEAISIASSDPQEPIKHIWLK